MRRAKAHNGKSWESEVGHWCQSVGAWSYNSNSANPACDRIVTLPVRFAGRNIGLALLAEAKEIRADRFPFNRIERSQRLDLEINSRAYGLSLILIKRVIEYDLPKAWYCSWQNWKVIEAAHGYDPGDDLIPINGGKKERRKPGTASFSLLDGERPFALLPLTVNISADQRTHWISLENIVPNGMELCPREHC